MNNTCSSYCLILFCFPFFPSRNVCSFQSHFLSPRRQRLRLFEKCEPLACSSPGSVFGWTEVSLLLFERSSVASLGIPGGHELSVKRETVTIFSAFLAKPD